MRGFKLRRPLIRFSRWVTRRAPKPGDRPPPSNPITKLLGWGRSLSKKTKNICSPRPGSAYVTLCKQPVREKPPSVPKGHLAVYVGKEGGETERVLVPAIYFNHPLFGELLREAEEEYGFQQQGGITIPCRFSEFQSVKTRIEGRRNIVARRRQC